MKYLLDTHIVIWWLANDARLDSPKRALLDGEVRQMRTIGISDFTLWEIAMLGERGRLEFVGKIDTWLDALVGHPAVFVLPIDHRIALDAVRLPTPFPRDPADRLIAATARVHGLTLVTQDRAIASSGLLATA